jgi:Zn finger protein HypA/HybF involved in hydrogenase expression
MSKLSKRPQNKPENNKFFEICIQTAKRNSQELKSKYLNSPKLCRNCNSLIEYENRRNNFCNHSCSAEYNNQKRRTVNFCASCEKEIPKRKTIVKYCGPQCQSNYQYKNFIDKWLSGIEDGITGEGQVSTYIRKWLFEKYNTKCKKCGWAEIHPTTGKIPLQVNHIDGNWSNNKSENLELICPSCHSLTPNYGSLNKGNGRTLRLKRIQEKKKV